MVLVVVCFPRLVLDDNSLNKEIEVYGEINWETRYMNMRHHSAIHVLCGVMYRDFKALVTGGQINLDKARVDFDVEGINSENKVEIEEGVNKIIQKDIKITAKNISREEALNIPDLVRTKPGMELVNRLKIIRIIEFFEFDFFGNTSEKFDEFFQMSKCCKTIVFWVVQNSDQNYSNNSNSLSSKNSNNSIFLT